MDYFSSEVSTHALTTLYAKNYISFNVLNVVICPETEYIVVKIDVKDQASDCVLLKRCCEMNSGMWLFAQFTFKMH